MPIFAKLRLGPSDFPNGYCIVEVISQIERTPFGWFTVQDPQTKATYEVTIDQLTLTYHFPHPHQIPPQQ